MPLERIRPAVALESPSIEHAHAETSAPQDGSADDGSQGSSRAVSSPSAADSSTLRARTVPVEAFETQSPPVSAEDAKARSMSLLSDFAIGNRNSGRPSLGYRTFSGAADDQQDDGADSRIGRAMMLHHHRTPSSASSGSSAAGDANAGGSRRRWHSNALSSAAKPHASHSGAHQQRQPQRQRPPRRQRSYGGMRSDRSSCGLDDDDEEDENERYFRSGPPSPTPEESWGGSGGGEYSSGGARYSSTGASTDSRFASALGARLGIASTGKLAMSPAPLSSNPLESAAPLDEQSADLSISAEESDPLAKFDARRNSGGSKTLQIQGAPRAKTDPHPTIGARTRSASNCQDGSSLRDNVSVLRKEATAGGPLLGRAASWGRAAGLSSVGSPRVRQGGIEISEDTEDGDPLASFAIGKKLAAKRKEAARKERQREQAEAPAKDDAQPTGSSSRPLNAHRSSGGSANSHMSMLSQALSDSSASTSGTASTTLTRPGSRLSGDSLASIGIGSLSQSLMHSVTCPPPSASKARAGRGSPRSPFSSPVSEKAAASFAAMDRQGSAASGEGSEGSASKSRSGSVAGSDSTAVHALAPALDLSPVNLAARSEQDDECTASTPVDAATDAGENLATPSNNPKRLPATPSDESPPAAASTPPPRDSPGTGGQGSSQRTPAPNGGSTPTIGRGMGLSEAAALVMSPLGAREAQLPSREATLTPGAGPGRLSSGDRTLSLSSLSLEQLPVATPPLPSAPVMADADPETFGEHVQRRHTGVFLSRTRSQMLSHPNMLTAFSGAGGGRAAARARAMQPQDFANAPFSVLEARAMAAAGSAASGNGDPRAATSASISGPALSKAPASVSVPASPGSAFSASGMVSPTWIAAMNSRPFMSPLTPAVPVATEKAAAPTTTSTPPMNASSPPVNGLGAPWPSMKEWNGFTSLTSLSDIGDLMRSPSEAADDDTEELTGDDEAAAAALHGKDPSVDSDGSVGGGSISRPMTPSRAAHKRKSAGALTLSTRPIMGRSQSGLLPNMPMMRTPTTQEWSRFLAQQGVDPTLSRSRTGTGSSKAGGRLAQGPPSELDLDEGASDSDGSSGGHEEGFLERLQRHLSSSRLALGESAGQEAEEVASAIAQTPGMSSSPATSPGRFAFGPASSPPVGAKNAAQSSRPSPSQPSRLERSADQQSALGYTPHAPGRKRTIQDFAITCDIGRGAYGLVKKAQLKDDAGRPHGREFIIKYIIKSRILADCWRRHRVLGPIPIEIHVMDQLRRLPYEPRKERTPWSPEKLFPGTPAMKGDAQGAAASLHHPNLAQMVDFFEDHEFYYLVMPCFGKGQDLFDFVEGAPDGLDARHVRCICGQVADGLAYLHAHNIVHRDIKDENVILDGKGHAQIIDFGSAAHIKPGRLFDTFSGTLDYAAAEILQGEKYSGKEQDVWALGVVLYVLMCGECPFWNGEEAVAGLAPGSRAAEALAERCMIGDWVRQQSANGNADADADDGIGDTDEQLTRAAPPSCSDRGQADGGGKLADAADLIHCCLSLNKDDRPTAAQVCQHRFLIGHQGWHGHRGWEKLQ